MSFNRNINSLKKKQKPFRLSISQKFLLLFLLVIALVRVLPIVLVLSIGLLPTITLLIVSPKNFNKLIVVGCFNMAGVFVYVFNIMKNVSANNALFVFSDIFNIILMLCSAGIGLLLYYEIPLIFIYLAKISNQRRVANIDSKLEKLQEVWGQDVLGKQ